MWKTNVLCVFLLVVTSLVASVNGIFCETKYGKCKLLSKNGGCRPDEIQNQNSCEYSAPIPTDSDEGCTNDPYTEHPAIRPNKLTHKISPYNNGYFELTVEWSKVEFAVTAYDLEITTVRFQNEVNPPAYIMLQRCITPGNRTTASILMDYSFINGYSYCDQQRQFQIHVMSIPYRKRDPISSPLINWPNNCFELANETICGSHNIGVPTKTSVTTEIFFNTTKMSNTTMMANTTMMDNTTMIAHISWMPPNTSHIYKPNVYYLILRESSQWKEWSTFKITNSTLVSIGPLNSSLQYVVHIQGYDPGVCNRECSSKDGYPSKSTCGKLNTFSFSYIPELVSSSVHVSSSEISYHSTPSFTFSSSSFPPSSSSFSSPSSSSSSTFVTTSAAETVPPTARQVLQPSLPREMVGLISTMTIGVVIIILIIIIALLVTRYKKGRHFVTPKRDDSSETETTDTEYSVSNSPLPSLPIMDISVVVVESLRLSSEKKSETFVLLDDELDMPGITVKKYEPSTCGTAANFMNKHIPKADKVICVCTEEFSEEWNKKHTENSPVHGLRLFVEGCVNQGKEPSEKYIVVIFDKDDNKYIPGFLCNCNKVYIEEIEVLRRYITRTPERILV